MTGGEIAALIAAGAFLLFVLILAIPIVKTGRVIDESRFLIRDISTEVKPLIREANETLTIVNADLAKFDSTATNLAHLADNLTGAAARFTGAMGGPLGKFAGLVAAFTGGRRKAKKRKKD